MSEFELLPLLNIFRLTANKETGLDVSCLTFVHCKCLKEVIAHLLCATVQKGRFVMIISSRP